VDIYPAVITQLFFLQLSKMGHGFKKFQKELKRKKKAKEKLARRQGKKDQAVNDVDEQKYSD
jgi:hypothetical protein